MEKQQKLVLTFSRFAIFIVYFWFGILKVFDLSPASPLVAQLQAQTLPFLSFSTFIISFGLFEMFIGILFLIPKWEKVAFGLMLLHMFTACLPIVLVPQTTWTAFLVPSLEGQYIIKNLVLISLAWCLVTFSPKTK